MTDFDCACALWREHVVAAHAGEALMAHLKLGAYFDAGAVAGVVGIESGVVSGVFNLESSGVRASDWRPRHDKRYHEA